MTSCSGTCMFSQVGKGLNFDEIVVYKNEAALPTHLIVYALH